MQVNAALSIEVCRGRTGGKFLQTIIEKRFSVGQPIACIESRAVNAITQIARPVAVSRTRISPISEPPAEIL